MEKAKQILQQFHALPCWEKAIIILFAAQLSADIAWALFGG